MVSLYTTETGLNVNNFFLRARPKNDQRFSILCEKGKILIVPSGSLPTFCVKRVRSLLTIWVFIEPCGSLVTLCVKKVSFSWLTLVLTVRFLLTTTIHGTHMTHELQCHMIYLSTVLCVKWVFAITLIKSLFYAIIRKFREIILQKGQTNN